MIGRVWRRFNRFWQEDRGLTVFLALLVVGLFVVPVVIQQRPFARFFGDVLFTLLLVTGAWAVSWRKALAWVVSVSAAAALLVRWTARLVPLVDLSVAKGISSLVTLVLLAAIVLTRVFQQGRITRQRIEGAVAAYLLFGLIWAETYELVALFRPGAFGGTGTGPGAAQDFVYFSFTTLTTVGYGDITPAAPVARSLANLESLVGLLYPAILLARLVSMEVAAGARGRADDGRS
ncbi:MAG TPA: potassium channel family protein [Thermoanaerobaculia bacterium]|nr:potassium channel family protein [Thermoanaerobaculia bacterium]HQR65977.1 potassium channel family protein [Thermoanaerobaculia bacterium]